MLETKINFVCPQCTAINKVPRDRLEDYPICAKCKTQLTSLRHPIELSEESFDKFIKKSDSLIVVDFWAQWCGPCRMMAGDYAKAATDLAPDVVLAKVNTEECPNVSRSFHIAGIPCLIAFRDGKEVARQAGAMKVDQIVGWVGSVKN